MQSLFLLTLVLCVVGVRPDIAAEEKRVDARVAALMEGTVAAAPSFRGQRAKAYVLAVFQERIIRVGRFVGSLHAAMAALYRTMFPLNPQPQHFEDLMAKFSTLGRIKDLVRAQLIGGAKVALAFVRAHHPQINLGLIGRSLPLENEDDRLQMEVLYDMAATPAAQIIQKVEAETRRQLECGWVPPVEEP